MAGSTLKFKVKKHVTVELFKVPDNGTPVYVTITSEIFKAMQNHKEEAKYEEQLAAYNKVMSEGTPEAKRDAVAPQAPNPPLLAHIVNLETGQVMQIIVGKILEGELTDAYPNHTYVGKSFEIKKLKPTGSKRYAMYQVAEIELDEETAAVVARVAPTTKSGHSAPHGTSEASPAPQGLAGGVAGGEVVPAVGGEVPPGVAAPGDKKGTSLGTSGASPAASPKSPATV